MLPDVVSVEGFNFCRIDLKRWSQMLCVAESELLATIDRLEKSGWLEVIRSHNGRPALVHVVVSNLPGCEGLHE